MASDLISKLEEAFAYLAPHFGSEQPKLKDVVDLRMDFDHELYLYKQCLDGRNESQDAHGVKLFENCDNFHFGERAGHYLVIHHNKNKFYKNERFYDFLIDIGATCGGYMYDEYKCADEHEKPSQPKLKKAVKQFNSILEDIRKTDDMPKEKAEMLFAFSGVFMMHELGKTFGYFMFKHDKSKLPEYAKMSDVEAFRFLKEFHDQYNHNQSN